MTENTTEQDTDIDISKIKLTDVVKALGCKSSDLKDLSNEDRKDLKRALVLEQNAA